jgi:heptosyltransferase-2
MANGPLEPCIHVPEPLLGEARALLAASGWDAHRPLIAIAPGAAYGTAKQWPPEYFAQTIGGIARTLDAYYVLLGSRSDAGTTAQVRNMVERGLQDRVIDLAGRTSLGMLAAILALSRACIANDSGALHLAAAAGAPVAALFGPTREYESAPLTHAGVPAEVLINPVFCRPCMLRECPIDHRCMRGLEPARAIAAVTRMVAQTDADAASGASCP